MTGVGADDRGVSEATGAAILILITVIATGTVGLNVLLLEQQDSSPGPNAEFTFEYFGDASSLLVTHDSGDEFQAGNLLLRSSQSQVTWADAAGTNQSASVEPGATIQLSAGGAFDARVESGDTVTVNYVNDNGTEVTLDQWNGTS
jgi:flagellin-like protein